MASERHRSGIVTRCSAPSFAARPATATAWSHARWNWSSPLWNPVKTVPADSLSPRDSSSSDSWDGSVGRYPYGPSSIHSYPAADASSRKRCHGTCFGSSGNQTPHESGAVPMRIEAGAASVAGLPMGVAVSVMTSLSLSVS